MTRRAPASSSLAERDLAVVFQPCSQMKDYETFPPMEIAGANGPYLELADGRRVIDGISSWWCKSVGHRHPAIIDAVRRQFDRFGHVILANTTNESIVRLSERLVNFANGCPVCDWEIGRASCRERV